MKKIVLLCALGLSTGILVSRMQAAARAEGIPCEIAARSVYKADSVADADCILLGPQVAYQAEAIQKRWPKTPVLVIDQKAFSELDGKKILALCLNAL